MTQLPPVEREELLALRGRDDGIKWERGLRVQYLVDQYGAAMGKGEVRRLAANDLGIGADLARTEEWVARNYKGEARTRFGDQLTWAYFHTALSAPDPLKALEQCLQSADDFGGVIEPVSAFRARLAKANGREPDFETLIGRALSALRIAMKKAKWRAALQVIIEELNGMLE